jgi:hypothetical protein
MGEAKKSDVNTSIHSHLAALVDAARDGCRVPRERKRVAFTIYGTLSELFDAITKADPRFNWQQNNSGSVYFLTQRTPQPLMDVTVGSFGDENPQEGEIVDRLIDGPELYGWLQDHGCEISHDVIVGGQLPKPWGKFSVHAIGLPLPSVLDEFAASLITCTQLPTRKKARASITVRTCHDSSQRK